MSSPFFANPRTNPELKCLYEISQLPSHPRLQDYFWDVIEKMSEYFPIEYSTLILHDAHKDSLSVEAVYGIRKEDHPSTCSHQEGVIGTVFKSRKPRVIQTLLQEPLYQAVSKGTKRGEKIHPPMPCVPILANGSSVGILITNSLYGPREECIEDLQFLSLLTLVLSPVIQNFQAKKVGPLAKPDHPKLKFSGVEESLERRLIEVLDKIAPYTESKAHTGVFDDIISVVEKILIQSALEKVDFVQVAAAELLGINRNTLRKKITDLKIKIR